MTGGKDMYEDANGVMIPDSMMLREVYHAFHHGISETVIERFEDIGSLRHAAPCLEPIDNDPAINALLTAENL